MSSVSTSSDRTSERTSSGNPGKDKSLADKGKAAAGSPGSDAYLREQADEARQAVAKAVGQLKSAVAGTVDPRFLPRKFPFITVGAVALVGFVAAVATIPSKEQQELKRLEKIRRAMYPEPKPSKQDKTAVDEAKSKDKAKPDAPWWSTLLKEGITAARPLLVTLVTTQMKARQQSPSDPPPGDAG